MSRHHQKLDKRRWAIVRWQALNRAGWRCELCGRAGRMEVHHRVGLARGGAAYSLDNLQAVCRPCHFDQERAANEERQPPEVRAWRALVRGRLSEA